MSANADEDALRALRAAIPALQKRWPDGESPRSWRGVEWSDNRVHELSFRRLKELPPQVGQLQALTALDLTNCPLKELPPQFGQLLALANLDLSGCDQLTLAPGAEERQQAQTIVAAYARLLIVEPRKDTPGQLHAFLLANPLWEPAFFKFIVGDLTGEAILADWLGEAIKATPELAQLTAPDGRSITDVAEQARLSRATAKPDEDALRAIRAASPALQREWPDGEMSPRSWKGVYWSDDRVQKLYPGDSGLEVLAPQIGQLQALTQLWLGGCRLLKELPPQVGQLLALTDLGLNRCEQLTLAPGAKVGQPAQTIVAAYAFLLIVEPRKDAPGELHAFLLANPLAVPAFFKHIVGDLTGDAILADWLGKAIKATPELAHLTAPDGRSITDVAEEARLSRATARPDEEALRAIRAASPALQEWWPDGEVSPRSWKGVRWSDDRVKRLDLEGSRLEVLAPQIGQLQALTDLIIYDCPLKELPPQVGLLLALTDLRLGACEQLTLAPGAKVGQPAQTIVAAYTRLHLVKLGKDTPGQLHAFLLANPLAVPAFFKTILIDAAHADWLGEAANAAPELAELTDASGRRAIDVAHATCRRRMQASSRLCKRYELQPGPPEHRSATSVVIRAEDHADKPDYAQIFDHADTDKSGTLEGKELDLVANVLGLSKDLVVSEANKHRSATSTDGTATIQLGKDAFVSACKQLLGDGPRKVVIKLMKDEVQWQREMESRSWEWDPATNTYVPSHNQQEALGAQYVVQALEAPTQAEMAAAVSESPLLQQLAEKYMEQASIKEYAYPVVMDAANRNLAQIYLQERPGLDSLRDLARQIFEAVQHLHSRKLMHGDLKVRAPPLLCYCSAASPATPFSHLPTPSICEHQILAHRPISMHSCMHTVHRRRSTWCARSWTASCGSLTSTPSHPSLGMMRMERATRAPSSRQACCHQRRCTSSRGRRGASLTRTGRTSRTRTKSCGPRCSPRVPSRACSTS